MQFCISFLIDYYELTMLCCIENSVDPDQLALKQPADQDPHCFPLRSGFIFLRV